MKIYMLIMPFFTFIFSNYTNGQTNQIDNKGKLKADTRAMESFEFSLKTAHPNAKALMTDDFFWSPNEETGPFGSDDGWEAAQEFKEWSPLNKSKSPIVYLKELIARWQYPFFDWNEMDTMKIRDFIVSRANIDEESIQQQIQQLKEVLKNSPDTSMKSMDDSQLRQVVLSSSKEMGGVFLLNQDNAIIGTGFAQFALEGKVDNDLKALTIMAIKRQLLPLLINRYDSSYRDTRKLQLTKMLEVISKAPIK